MLLFNNEPVALYTSVILAMIDFDEKYDVVDLS